MVPTPRVHNGWTWTGMTVAGKWRFRKFVGGKPVLLDVAPAVVAKADLNDPAKVMAAQSAAIQAALDAADAAGPVAPAPAQPNPKS